MFKHCPYHQNNGHTLEECFTVKDKIYILNDKGEIMWSELKTKLKATQGDQLIMQIHQDPMFDHAIAHADAGIILSATRSEFATIQCIQADPEQSPSSEEDLDLKAPSTPTLNPQTFQDMI